MIQVKLNYSENHGITKHSLVQLIIYLLSKNSVITKFH